METGEETRVISDGEKQQVSPERDTANNSIPVNHPFEENDEKSAALVQEALQKVRSALAIAQNERRDRGSENPYRNSTAAVKLKECLLDGKPLRIAIFDLDATMTGNPERQIYARQLLEKLGYVVVFITSRTEEMVMSRTEFQNSQHLGFSRPEPKMGTTENIKTPLFADEYAPYQGLYNPDIIAGSTGSSNILIHQEEGGYSADLGFGKEIRRNSEIWRESTMGLLQQVDPTSEISEFSPLEDIEGYLQGRNDVAPQDFRISIEFPLQETRSTEHTGSTSGNEPVNQTISAQGLERKIEYVRRFEETLSLAKKNIREKITDEIVDEERDRFANQLLLLSDIKIVEDSNPEKGVYRLLFVPKRGYKARAAENIVNALATEIGVTKDKLEVLFAGDSYPDLDMGLYGATGTQAAFLLAGDSRLTTPLTRDEQFSGNSLSAIVNPSRFIPLGEGRYSFTMPIFGQREVIIADEAFPGKPSVESVISYLEQKSTAAA